MSLRRFLIASSLIVAPIATIGFASTALADTTSTVTLGGSVSSTLAVTSSATSDASSLPMSISTPGNQVVKIADLTVTTNNSAGLTLTATTGDLTSGSDTVPFTVAAVDDGGTAPTSFATTSGSTYSLPVTTGFNATTGEKNIDLYIQVQNPTLPKKGTYAGSILLTVADN